eukprot:scpid73416/ scgid34070/ 
MIPWPRQASESSQPSSSAAAASCQDTASCTSVTAACAPAASIHLLCSMDSSQWLFLFPAVFNVVLNPGFVVCCVHVPDSSSSALLCVSASSVGQQPTCVWCHWLLRVAPLDMPVLD